MNARGMPDVSISQNTQDKLEQEATENKPKSQEEMFDSPKLEIKPIVKEKVVKPKKPRSQAQLDALAKGRETSMKNRVSRAKKLKEEQNVKNNSELGEEPKPPHPAPAMPIPIPAQPPQMIYQQPEIDYDKIINGVANIYDKRRNQKSQEQLEKEKLDKEVADFETKIREDERQKIRAKYEEKEKEKLKEKAHKKTNEIYSRQPNTDANVANPYAYAFGMNSRNRFSRY